VHDKRDGASTHAHARTHMSVVETHCMTVEANWTTTKCATKVAPHVFTVAAIQ